MLQALNYLCCPPLDPLQLSPAHHSAHGPAERVPALCGAITQSIQLRGCLKIADAVYVLFLGKDSPGFKWKNRITF